MIGTLLPAPEFRPDGPRLELDTLPEVDIAAELGGTTLRLYDETELRTNDLGAVMRRDDEPSLDPRDPRFEGEEEESETGTPPRDPETLPDPDNS